MLWRARRLIREPRGHARQPANPIFDAANGLFNLGVLGLDDHLELDLQIAAAETMKLVARNSLSGNVSSARCRSWAPPPEPSAR